MERSTFTMSGILNYTRSNMDAPEIAKDYWRLSPDAKMTDVIYAVRSDEVTHRFVNHSLANLKPDDINPFALREPDMHVMGTNIEYIFPFAHIVSELTTPCVDSTVRRLQNMHRSQLSKLWNNAFHLSDLIVFYLFTMLL